MHLLFNRMIAGDESKKLFGMKSTPFVALGDNQTLHEREWNAC